MKSKAHKTDAFWFKRNITDLKDNIKNEKSAKYVDIVEVSRRKWGGRKLVKEVDKSAESLLKVLKDKRLPQSIDKANIAVYHVKWCESGLDPRESPEHAQYIDTLCHDFYHVMREAITNKIKDRAASGLGDRQFEEITRHSLICRRKCVDFHGREETLEKIKNHVTSSAQTPLVIYGASGCGTTSLVAMAAQMARSWLGDEAVVVLRFLGTTPDSSSMHLVLRSVCFQLSKVFGVDSKTIPQVRHKPFTRACLEGQCDKRVGKCDVITV